MRKRLLLAAGALAAGMSVAVAGGMAESAYRPVGSIFEAGTVTVSGRIDGYDEARMPKLLCVGVCDAVLSRTSPVALKVNADGSFSRTFTVPMAQVVYLSADGKAGVPVYLEPGNDVEIELRPAETRDGSLKFEATFGGSLGRINNDIALAPDPSHYLYFTFTSETQPAEARRRIDEFHGKTAAETEEYIAGGDISAKSAEILRNTVKATRIIDQLSYASYNDSHRTLPPDFCEDYLAEALRSDSTILSAANAPLLLNRVAFNGVLPEYVNTVNVGIIRRAMDFIAANGGELSADDLRIIGRVADLSSADTLQMCSVFDTIWVPDALIRAAQRIDREAEMRSLLFDGAELFGSLPGTNSATVRRLGGSDGLPIVWQFAQSAIHANHLGDFAPQMTETYGISHPYIIARVSEAARERPATWALPDSDGGRLMGEIIAPYRGKYLLVDFWDVFCGPCRKGIESNAEMRRLHRGNPDFAILFIASESGSPEAQYEEYVAKNLAEETVLRLPDYEMAMLQELFEFNSIPRYVLFAPDGQVGDSDYSTEKFWEMLRDKGLIADY